MQAKMLIQITAVVVVSLCTLTTKAAPTEVTPAKNVKDMVVDPEGFVYVAEDGVARSYAPNGTVVDYVPFSNAQLKEMVNDLPLASDEKRHLATIFAKVDGFAVKDHHQIFHPSTQLRPATDPALTHWQEDTDEEEADSDTALGEGSDIFVPGGVNRGKMPKPCTGKPCHNNAECAKIDCPGKSCFHAIQHYFLDLWLDLEYTSCC